ncbi:IniB N-terminal domain-containing protein [Lentzea alba]|uniref:IniB N-terminal domain-containing protein n=1 Tax=Lentzea alba TaxID=2714351 RepID=UPI0039BFCB90
MLSNLIDFLMNLLKDDDAKKAFDENPDSELKKAGLNGVTGQDVRDARLIMADSGGVRARGEERSSSHDDDPVREIHHTTREYVVEKPVTNIEQNISIDDRDVTIIDDSFNSDDDTEVNSVAIQDNDTNVVQVKDSFNDKDEEPEPVLKEEDVPLEPKPLDEDPEIVLDDPVVLPEPEPEPLPEALPVDVEPEPLPEPDPVIA